MALLIRPTGELCKRLRVLLSYLALARARDCELHVVWTVTDACPGHFLHVFLPIVAVRFFSMPYRACDYVGSDPRVPIKCAHVRAFLSPKPHVAQHTRAFLAAHAPFIAIHARKRNNLAPVLRFAMKHPQLPVYVVSDDAGTHSALQRRLGKQRCIPPPARRLLVHEATAIYACARAQTFFDPDNTALAQFVRALQS